MAACSTLRQGGMLHVFIEGTRSPDDNLMPPKPQVGALALDTGATVVPLYFRGMHRVHPYRKMPCDPPETWWRRWFGTHTEWLLDIRAGHHIVVEVGQPITPQELQVLAGSGEHRERVTRLSCAIMERLQALRSESFKT